MTSLNPPGCAVALQTSCEGGGSGRGAGGGRGGQGGGGGETVHTAFS